MKRVAGMASSGNFITLIAMITFLVARIDATSVALCYAWEPNVTALSKFDWAVVDSDANFEPPKRAGRTTWLSYVSIGEVTEHRTYFKEMPRDWLIGKNTDWAAYVINQTASGWPLFFVDKICAPLINRGFKGFFIDTLDSYQLVAKIDAERTAQEDGLARVILALKARFPSAILILNRGFEILASVHSAANMVAFESLYAGWSQARQKYAPVSQNDRNWLLARAREIKNQYHLPVLSIDYCPPKNSTCIQTTVNRIKRQGIVPYVTDPMLQTVGVGA